MLFTIVSNIVINICDDKFTNKPKLDREFEHYVMILVDIYRRKSPIYRVLVERSDFAFFVDIDYENIPEFHNHCKCVGHS